MRRLALFAYAFSAAALVSVLIGTPVWSFIAGAGLLFLFVLAVVLRKQLPEWLHTILMGLAVGLVWCFLWNAWMLAPTEGLNGHRAEAEATVLEYPVETTYGESVMLRIGRVKARLYLDGPSGLIPGQRIRFTAKFSLTAEKTGEDYYLSLGVPLFAYGEGAPESIGTAKHPWRFWPAKLGARLQENIHAVFDGASAPFLTALLTGERAELKADTFFYAMLKESGVVHCIAISGMHLSFLVSFLYLMLGKGKHSSLICIPVILAFMAMTGFTASVVRAGVMQLAICAGMLLDREYDSHSALALALLLLTAWNPYCLLNTGLQLSFASTLGILLFAAPISKALPKLPKAIEKRRIPGIVIRYVRSSLSVSLSAMILTVPISVISFRQLAILGPVTNLLILWAVSLCFAFGLLAALTGFVSAGTAVIIGYPARILVRYIAAVVKFIGKLPFASLYPDGGMITAWIFCAYCLLLAFRFLPGIEHRLRSFLCAALVSLLAFRSMGLLLYRQDAVCAAVLDVGQGQCTVFSDRAYTVITDCGGSGSDNAGDTAARYLLSHGIQQADALVLTHFHSDHANGALELLRRIPVRLLVVPPVEDGDEAAETLLREAETLGIQVMTVSGSVTQLNWDTLTATIVPPLGGAGDNEQGLFALLAAGEFEMLVTGDASQATERRLLERLTLPDIEVLAVGHHGSRTSTSPQLLEAAAPDTAVISVGRNSYGLPNDETLYALTAADAAVYRTDENGTIEIRVRDRKGASEDG